MLHVFRLGPFPVGDKDAYAYGSLDEHGGLVPPAVAHSDEEGLRELARGHAGPLRCEPALAHAGAPLGFEPAPLPRAALEPRAVLAFGLVAAGGWRQPPPLPVLLRFFEACAAYWRARPWDAFDSDDPLRAEIDGGGARRLRELSVLGAAGENYGLALYAEPGAVARVVAAVNRGDRRAAMRCDCTTVLLEPEPAWAASAFEDAFRFPRLPLLLGVRGAKEAAPTADEVLALTAALEATAALAVSDDLAPSAARVEIGGQVVTARVSEQGEDDDPELAEPMLVPEPTAPAGRSERMPRNAPCPCGSGRKYKKCHLAEDEARERAARGTGPEADEARARERRLAERDPVHGLDERITADALALARRRWGRPFDPEGALRACGLDDPAILGLLGWCAGHHRGPDGRTALELWLAERAGDLDDAGRRLTAARQAAWFSLHEVLAAVPGESVTLRDLLAGGEHVVRERSASRTLAPREVILATVLELGDRAVLGGCHPRVVPPRAGDVARRAIRKLLRTRARLVAPAALRELTADASLFAIWQANVRQLDALPPPHLCNTDGEDLLLTVDRFEIAPGAAEELVTGLLALPGARREDGGTGPTEIAFIREGNAMGALPTTLVGRAVLTGDRLRLETNSLARADRLRGLVQDRLGAGVRFRIREHGDPTARAAEAAGRPAAAPQELPPDALEALRQLKAEHYARWLDEAIPALRGLTPRQAAKKRGAVREALCLLLSEAEHAEARQPEGQRFDVSFLRRELALER